MESVVWQGIEAGLVVTVDWKEMWRVCQSWVVLFVALAMLWVIWRTEIYPLRSKPKKPQVEKPKTVEDREYLRMMYEEQAEHARLHEELRGTATSLFMALIAGLLAWAVGESEGHPRASIAGFLILAASVIGAIVNLKHYERFQMHLSRLRGFRKSLESEVTDSLREINEKWTDYHNETRPIASWISLHMLWNVIYVATSIIGISLVAYGSFYKVHQ